ncbi:hypothetical protein ACFX12_007721 [Malus domestica]
MMSKLLRVRLSDNRIWSFGKRSARHRVLSNTVIKKTPTYGHKEIPESTALNFQPPAKHYCSRKDIGYTLH